ISVGNITTHYIVIGNCATLYIIVGIDISAGTYTGVDIVVRISIRTGNCANAVTCTVRINQTRTSISALIDQCLRL
ncbi:hypothetical protein EBU71_21970, partial [bacterium]|nr:hypothetical protein [Candidatus Elulimicrobium humile]